MKNPSLLSLKNWLCAGMLTGFAAFFSPTLQAQIAPAKLWDKSFGGSDMELFSSLHQTSDGGYILGGSSLSGISGNKSQANKGGYDYWVVKLDASGNKTWDKPFGGNGYDELTSLQQTSDGGYILGGNSQSGISGDKSQPSTGYWIVKLDASGNKLWDKTFTWNKTSSGNDEDYLSCLQQTSDGGYILGTYSNSGIGGDKTQASKGQEDYWVIKLDASGNKIWDKTFGGNSSDLLSSLQQTSDGGYILGGRSQSDISGDKTQANKSIGAATTPDYWVVKLDASGNKIWDKTIGGGDVDGLNSLQQTSDGGYILGGFSMSGISGDKTQANHMQGAYNSPDYWVVKLDASGNKTWDKTFGGSDDDRIFSLQQTSDGGYILGGYSGSDVSGDKTQASRGGFDYWVVKLDASGNKTWNRTLGGDNSDVLKYLHQTSDGGYILGGDSQSGTSGDKSQASQGYSDLWVVKLAGSVTGIKESEAGLALSISPNPSKGRFNIQLSGITAPSVEVTVSDLLGRVVLQQELQATDKHISEELELPASKGIYLLQLKTGKQITTRKIVVE